MTDPVANFHAHVVAPGPGQIAPDSSFGVATRATWFDDGKPGWIVDHPDWLSDEFNESFAGVVSEHETIEEATWVARALNFRADAEEQVVR